MCRDRYSYGLGKLDGVESGYEWLGGKNGVDDEVDLFLKAFSSNVMKISVEFRSVVNVS